MRIIAGKNRSLPLKTPKGEHTRPTTDRIKETLFNMIAHEIHGCKFLDLFSGSGGIGLEAASRGASKVYLVDNNKEAASCIRDNIAFTKSQDTCVFYQKDVFTALKTIVTEGEMDIIFMDPPYGLEYEKEALSLLSGSPLVGEHTLIIVEADLNTSFDYLENIGFKILKYKKYKTNAHIFIQKI